MTIQNIAGYIVIFFSFYLHSAYSNNLRFSNIELTNKDNSAKTTEIKFDIYWENSWRTSGGINNWDAVWIFAKFRRCQSGSPLGEWKHCKLSSDSSQYTVPNNFSINAAGDSMGALFYRKIPGTGTVNETDIHLKWLYGENNIEPGFEVEVKLFGVEMVYVPEGAFYVGDGSTAANHGTFYTYPNVTDPYYIDSEDAIDIDNVNGKLFHTSSVPANGGDFGTPIPAAFPKGYDAYYMMKYEPSQKQYADFLNTLPNSVHANNRRPPSNAYRQTITGSWPFFIATAPNRACNYLSWEDAKAYMDWAALRPMTEFEWEKGARGTVYPQPMDFPWGNELVGSSSYTLVNDGTDSARTSALNTTHGNMNYDPSDGGVTALTGPWRCGIFANDTTTRMEAGASYYGAMEMAGNLMEYVISYGAVVNRAFTGSHGDGTLNATNGEATNSDWPVTSSPATKGGSFDNSASQSVISNRNYAIWNTTAKHQLATFRAARTEP